MTGLICLHMFFLLQFHWLIFYDPTFHISAFKPLDLEGSVLLLKNMFIGQLNGGELCFTLPLPLPPHPSSSTHRSFLEQLDSIFTDFKIIAHLTCNRSLIFSLYNFFLVARWSRLFQDLHISKVVFLSSIFFGKAV